MMTVHTLNDYDWTELPGASWPDQLVYQGIVWKWNVCRNVY
jgi:hypothetical protein